MTTFQGFRRPAAPMAQDSIKTSSRIGFRTFRPVMLVIAPLKVRDFSRTLMGEIMPARRFKHARIRAASLAAFARYGAWGKSLAASGLAAGLLLAGLAVP